MNGGADHLGNFGKQSSTFLGKKGGFSTRQVEFDVLMENLCKVVQLSSK